MSAQRVAIGLDLGGSSAKIAVVSAAGDVLAEDAVPTVESRDPLTVLAPVAAAIDRLRDAATNAGRVVVALGCGVPGNLDPTRERILYNNVVALDGFALAAWLRRRHDLPVALDNDAVAAALGEVSRLSPSDHGQRVLFVTVGSGIGAVLIVGGAVVRLAEGVTGDAGHIIVDQTSEARCPVGCRGCLETVASGTAIARAGRRAAESDASPILVARLNEGGAVDGADVAAAAIAGDLVARDILREAGRWLGIGLASMAPLYAPDLVLLGGGVARADDEWLGAAAAALREHGMPHYAARVRLRRAALGDRAGVIGAALLALEELK